MAAKFRFHQKITLIHEMTEEVAIAELKVVEVPESNHYPNGLKYSMFLVFKDSGKTVVGFDNHKPKGPHLHHYEKEVPYEFLGVDKLIEDFWGMVKKEGFII